MGALFVFWAIFFGAVAVAALLWIVIAHDGTASRRERKASLATLIICLIIVLISGSLAAVSQ